MNDPLDPLVAYEDDPQTDRVHHPYSAYNQGYDARLAGHSRSACPYTHEHRHVLRSLSWKDWWEMGWDEAGDPFAGWEDEPLPPPSTRAAPATV